MLTGSRLPALHCESVLAKEEGGGTIAYVVQYVNLGTVALIDIVSK